jgi:hypothetical protein
MSNHPQLPRIKKRPSAHIIERSAPQRVGNSHVWLFEGAEGGKWLQELVLAESEGVEKVDDGATGDNELRESKKPRIVK